MTAPTTAQTKGLAIVCVGFDAETADLTKAALSLARRTGAALRFVNVLEPMLSGMWVADMPLYNVSANLIYESQKILRQEREATMRELMSSLPKEIEASSALLTGDAVHAILQDAQAHGANVILTACNLERYGSFMPQGFSVALQLMAEAPLPVLVSSRAHPLDFDQRRFTILLADDLQPTSEEAARKTFELAAILGECRVRHVHVHGDFREVLHGTWLDLQARHPALQKAGESPEAIIRAEYEARAAALSQRGGSFRDLAVARGVTVELDVRTGNVADNLAEEMREIEPDLVVFGRHRTFKARPYLIGRVGVRAMLQAKRPVLVVPPHEDLYAAMPFPVRGN